MQSNSRRQIIRIRIPTAISFLLEEWNVGLLRRSSVARLGRARERSGGDHALAYSMMSNAGSDFTIFTVSTLTVVMRAMRSRM